MIFLVGNASSKLYYITFKGSSLYIRLRYQRYEHISSNDAHGEMGCKSLLCSQHYLCDSVEIERSKPMP